MMWSRRLFLLKKDPHGVSEGPGALHRLTLREKGPEGAGEFDFATEMFIPDSMEPETARLSLQMFEDNGREQLMAKLDEWRKRDIKKLRFIV